MDERDGGTDIEGESRDADERRPALGIVRAGGSGEGVRWAAGVGPAMAVGAVVTTHALTTRLDAWRLSDAPTASPPLASAVQALATALVGVAWPTRLVLVTLLATAVAVACLVLALQRRQMPAVPAVLLGLVAAPLVWHETTHPTGVALVLAFSALLAWRVSPGLVDRAGVGGLAAGALALLLAGLVHHGAPLAGLRLVAADLGGPGCVLALAGLLRADGRGAVALAAILGAVTTWLGGDAQAAAMLPWAWMAAAAGIGTLWSWREPVAAGARPMPHAGWLVAGLAAFLILHAGARDWRARAEAADVHALWARAAGRAAAGHPLVAPGHTPAYQLVGAWRRTERPAPDDGRVGPGALVLPDAVDAAPWTGLALESQPAALASLAEVVEALPAPVLVVVGVARRAVSTLTPDDWQALGRLGGRPAASGPPQARVLIGVSGGRRLGRDAAATDRAVLERLPGDLLEPTNHPSPIDVRIEADAGRVVLTERGRPRATADDLLVAAYRLDGTLLSVWVGAGGRMLGSGLPGTVGPAVRRVRATLACRTVTPADGDADVGDLGVDGVLGVQATPGSRLEVTTRWPEGAPAAPAAFVSTAGANLLEVPAAEVSPGMRRAWQVDDARPFGLDLRGRPEAVLLTTTATTQVCAASAVPDLPTYRGAPLTIAPAIDAAFARGWHASEPIGDDRSFRWTDGAAGVLLVGLEFPSPAAGLVLTLEAQSVGTPGVDDRLRLRVNRWEAPPLPLRPGLATYTWQVPADAFRDGLNEVHLGTTLTIRPADVAAGTDGRLLGLAVYGVRLAEG